MRKKWLALALPLALILGLAGPASAQFERLTRPNTYVPGDNVPVGAFINDPGFELGAGGGAWVEMSSNFGTPLCSEATCGLGGGTGPDGGEWWTWFGGIGALEEGSVSQMVTVPATDDVVLSFRLETPVCSGDAADFMEVTVDGTQVFEVLGDDANCNVVGYNTVTIDISDAVTSNTFDLEFHSIVQGADPNLVTNFFVDNVDLSVGGGGGSTLTITGTCPGDIDITLTGAGPGSVLGIMRGNGVGSDSIPGGPCAGTGTGLDGISLLSTLVADGAGGFSLSRNVPAGACGRPLQIIDTGSCTVSNVAQIP